MASKKSPEPRNHVWRGPFTSGPYVWRCDHCGVMSSTEEHPCVNERGPWRSDFVPPGDELGWKLLPCDMEKEVADEEQRRRKADEQWAEILDYGRPTSWDRVNGDAEDEA